LIRLPLPATAGKDSNVRKQLADMGVKPSGNASDVLGAFMRPDFGAIFAGIFPCFTMLGDASKGFSTFCNVSRRFV